MFKKLVVPLDGSKDAEQALEVAVHLAKAYGSLLLLVQVFDFPPILVETMGQSYFEFRDQRQKDAERYLKETADRLALGDSVECKVIQGHPTDELLQACADFSCDLVVMTSHGSSGIERWLLGSVAESVAHRCPTSALVLRAGRPVSLPLGKKILVPLDGSARCEAALPMAAELAEKAGGELLFYHSYHSAFPNSFEYADHELYPPRDEVEKNAAESSRSYLTGKADAVKRDKGVEVTVTVDENYPAEGILELAKEQDVELISITSHGATGMAKWIFGSTAEKILRHADRPILVTRAPE